MAGGKLQETCLLPGVSQCLQPGSSHHLTCSLRGGSWQSVTVLHWGSCCQCWSPLSLNTSTSLVSPDLGLLSCHSVEVNRSLARQQAECLGFLWTEECVLLCNTYLHCQARNFVFISLFDKKSSQHKSQKLLSHVHTKLSCPEPYVSSLPLKP